MTSVILSATNAVSEVEGPLLEFSLSCDRSTTALRAYAHDDIRDRSTTALRAYAHDDIDEGRQHV